MTTPILEIIDLHHRYGSMTALHRVSFEVQEGEMFGLLGPNGAGKTTLLSIISTLLEPTSGEVRIAGRNLQRGRAGSVSDRSLDLRQLIGIVPQDLALYGELTVRENLEFFGSLYRLEGGKLGKRIDEVMEATGLRGRGGERVESLSGGVKRRLNLAAALVHEPRLLLLDEPTTGVDPQSRNHIFEEVRRRNAAGVTVIFTGHYMEEVQALCRRIGIIDHGRLIACDTLKELLRQMDGVIRFQLPEVPTELADRFGQWPDVRLEQGNGKSLELKCRDVQGTMLRLVTALQELHLELTRLEMQEPNLERVFLHLTGHALRD